MDPDLDVRLEHVFDVRMFFDRRWVIEPLPGEWKQGYTSVKTGEITGPRLNGKLVDHSGADWPLVRADGVVELNAHYMIEADDGAIIYIHNLGYVYSAREPDRPTPYFRCTPYFRAPAGPHDWLNRTVIVGVGQRRPQLRPDDPPDHSLFRYYAI
ncbi:MAG TPA: DUF3237 domain-containing protein [Phenylobacterium sp.]|nr:DUF3237 domain-containing protein [Phenylobacterium sp.]